MKSRLWALSLLLITSSALGSEISGQSSLFLVNLKEDYARQTGYQKWKGKKGGVAAKLLLSQEFRIKRETLFKVSITSGSPKAPWIGSSLFERKTGKFSVRELYFRKGHFLFDGLTLTAGKQKFKIGVVLEDYLWGGKFEYRLGEKTKIVWQQIAGYEGRELLFGTKEEDDVDIFSLGIERKGFGAGVYRIMDARGKRSGISKGGVFGRVKGEKAELKGATQNGKGAAVGSLRVGKLKLSAGFAQRGFTSYGFREGVRDLGLIFKPSFSNLKFVKAEGRADFYGLRVKAYGVYLKRLGGKRIGGEIGVGAAKEIFKGWELFAEGALGSRGSYALFGGIRWGVKGVGPKDIGSWKLKVKNSFNVIGEYSDLPQKPYAPQLGYEGWESARHVGFWHSTYRLKAEGRRFGVQVATGRSSKVDYLVWGDTADCFKYQRDKGKEWHLEEAYLRFKGGKLGAFRVELPGLFDDYLIGGSYRWGRAEIYGVGTGEVQEGEGRALYGILKVRTRKGELFLGARDGKEREGFVGAKLLWRGIELGIVRELLKGRDGWGGYLKGVLKVKGIEAKGVYGVYSPRFTTFNLKEKFRNLGYTVRPTERDLRFLKVNLKRDIKTGVKKFDRLKPSIELIYNRFSRFSGKFVAGEGGVAVHLKPGKRCEFSLVGAAGSSGSYYEGIQFKVRW